MPIQTVREFQGTTGQYRDAQIALMAARGIGDDNIYPVQIDPATGSIAIAASAILDFGATASATRSAAMVGGYDVLPAPAVAGDPCGYTGTTLSKFGPNDARAQDVTAYVRDYAGSYWPQSAAPGGAIEIAGLVPESWAGLTVSYPSATQETYEFFRDAGKTTSICTITIDYSDASKTSLTSVTRT